MPDRRARRKNDVIVLRMAYGPFPDPAKPVSIHTRARFPQRECTSSADSRASGASDLTRSL